LASKTKRELNLFEKNSIKVGGKPVVILPLKVCRFFVEVNSQQSKSFPFCQFYAIVNLYY
jgi:hypothetical protein